MPEESRKPQVVSPSYRIAKCALFVALMIVSCLVTIPVGPVAFTLQTAVAITILLLCDPRETAMVMATYLLMGAIGLPVFSGMTGGIIRASSGFLFGFFVAGVGACALRVLLTRATGKALLADVVATAVYLVVDFAMGWAWFVWFAGTTGTAAFGIMVAPFILPDLIKAAAAIIVVRELRKRLPQLSA